MQATNEELETLNEELQATIEELNTTNDDLEARSIELQDLAISLEAQRVMSERDRARLQTVFDVSRDALLVATLDGEVILRNSRYLQLVGASSNRLETEDGRSVSDADLVNRAREESAMRLVFRESRQPIEARVDQVATDGETIIVITIAAPDGAAE